jgi:hypothetical protein
MIRAVAFGSHVSNPAGLIAQQLKSDFIAAQSLYSDEPDWNNIIALLSIAASSRAALVAPDSHAANLLRSARLQDGLTAVYELCQHLCDFAEHYVPLDPAALRYLTNESTWDEDMKRVKREAEAWWVAAPQVNINFGPARRVWQAWLEKGGIISTLIMPIRLREFGRCPTICGAFDTSPLPTLSATAHCRRYHCDVVALGFVMLRFLEPTGLRRHC